MSKITKQRENSNSTANQNSILWHGKIIRIVTTFVFDTVGYEGFVSFQSPKNFLIGWARVVDFEHRIHRVKCLDMCI